MDTLKLVEITGNGDLVLMTGDGRHFSLTVDEQVRSAVRRSRGAVQVTGLSERPGPREVQSRIRAGADADQVAAQTGLDVDYVRRFEGPVLAERAHVADLARATAVDRGGDPTLTLERVVWEVFSAEGHDEDDIRWDSRRSDGSRWQIVVSTTGSSPTEATWAFDTSTRSLEPMDDEAERLTGVERRRRLSAVRETVFDVERPANAVARGGTVELLDALARQRGRRPVPVRPTRDSEVTESDDDGTEAQDEPDAMSADEEHESQPATALRQDSVSIEPDLLSELDLDTPSSPGSNLPGSNVPRPDVPPPAMAATSIGERRARRRRTAVPSWDEIVFGAKRED